jgi:hypothetical protein
MKQTRNQSSVCGSAGGDWIRWLSEAEAREIRAHAAYCAQCGSALRQEENVQCLLGLLRADEPRIEASERAAQQLGQNAARTPLLRAARLAAVALAVVAAGVLVASNGNLRQTVR